MLDILQKGQDCNFVIVQSKYFEGTDLVDFFWYFLNIVSIHDEFFEVEKGGRKFAEKIAADIEFLSFGWDLRYLCKHLLNVGD